jgi:hypothetical protein
MMEKLKGTSFKTTSGAVLSLLQPNVFMKLLREQSSVKSAKMSEGRVRAEKRSFTWLQAAPMGPMHIRSDLPRAHHADEVSAGMRGDAEANRSNVGMGAARRQRGRGRTTMVWVREMVSQALFRCQNWEAKFTQYMSRHTVAILFLCGNNCPNLD